MCIQLQLVRTSTAILVITTKCLFLVISTTIIKSTSRDTKIKKSKGPFIGYYRTTISPVIQGWTIHMYLYVPEFWNVIVNALEDPG
jgi:hypothetical protein